MSWVSTTSHTPSPTPLVSVKKLDVPCVEMTVPLLVRVMELVREDIKSDINLHVVLETLLALGSDHELTMADYKAIADANPKS